MCFLTFCLITVLSERHTALIEDCTRSPSAVGHDGELHLTRAGVFAAAGKINLNDGLARLKIIFINTYFNWLHKNI